MTLIAWLPHKIETIGHVSLVRSGSKPNTVDYYMGDSKQVSHLENVLWWTIIMGDSPNALRLYGLGSLR
jgi:hypothetical protein